MTLVKHFKTQRDAKEFLVGEIVREAEREGRPLADLERKMLYFSKGDWPLPDDIYDVAEQFDRTYDRAQYEKKIAKLAQAARRQATTDQAAWSEAVRRLEEGDHYLLAMVGEAPRGAAMTWRGAIAVIAMLVAAGVLSAYFTKEEMGYFVWGFAVAVVVIGNAVRFFVGAWKFDQWISRVTLAAFRTRRR